METDRRFAEATGGTIRCNGRDIFEMGGEYRKLLGYLP